MSTASPPTSNIDPKTVDGFGREWERFNQSQVPRGELEGYFGEYFALFHWDRLPPNPRGFDVGCGTGRWAQFAAPRVGELHCVDPSERALAVAKQNLAGQPNCVFHLAGVDQLPLEDNSMDFGYSLGVLHHVPDTAAGIKRCADKLKPGAPLLLYLYYSFENRPLWFRWLWKISDLMRQVVFRLPYPIRFFISDLFAIFVYYPLARTGRLLDALGIMPGNWPLSAYRNRSLYQMRTDALDRFGTKLEQRFSRQQIRDMMEKAGLVDIEFKDGQPFWSSIGYKAAK